MKKADLEKYRKVLLSKRSELLDRVRSARTSESEVEDADAPDIGDRALSTMSRDLLYQLSAGERELLKRIDWALDRIGTGKYGSCDHCGKAVQSGRLQAVPWARHCLDCQELQDRGEIY